MTNATTFGQQASTYAKGRPGYPPQLYEWIAKQSPGQTCVWDVGTGSGQAAEALTQYFGDVYATDISPEQIAAASPHPQITYSAAPAHESGLTDNSVDAVTVATAVHWFADDKFWEEVRRVGREGSLFCAWTYQLPRSTTEIHDAFLDPIYDLIDPYWAEGNRVCMAGYTAEALSCPLPVLTPPKVEAGGQWTSSQLVNFAKSWSAYYRAKDDGLGQNLETLCDSFLSAFGGEDIPVSMPISTLAARIKT